MKKFMKRNIKVIVAVIITTLIVGTGTVYATYSYLASNISFTPTDSSWEVTNVEDALNDLYDLNTVDLTKLNLVQGTASIPVEIGKQYIIVFSVTSYYGSQNFKPSIVSGCNIDRELDMLSSVHSNVLCKYTKAYIVTATSDTINLKGNTASLSWNHIAYYKLN